MRVPTPGAYATGFNAAVDKRLDVGDVQLVAFSGALRERLDLAVQAIASESGNVADPQEVADHVFACVAENRPIHVPSVHDAEGLWANMVEDYYNSLTIEKELKLLDLEKTRFAAYDYVGTHPKDLMGWFDRFL